MFANQIRMAITGIRSLHATDEIMQAISQAAWNNGGKPLISEDEQGELEQLLHLRRLELRGQNKPVGASAAPPQESRPPLPRHLYPVRRTQRSPDRARSIARRRTLATAGVLPPALAAHFTTGELAVLAIIASDAGGNRQCDASIAEIAARAGVARTTVQNAVRRAGDLGLIFMTERRRPGRPNDTNLIRIISAEWKQWIKRGGKRPGTGVQAERAYWKDRGFKKLSRTGNPTDIKIRTTDKIRSKCPSGPPAAVA